MLKQIRNIENSLDIWTCGVDASFSDLRLVGSLHSNKAWEICPNSDIKWWIRTFWPSCNSVCFASTSRSVMPQTLLLCSDYLPKKKIWISISAFQSRVGMGWVTVLTLSNGLVFWLENASSRAPKGVWGAIHKSWRMHVSQGWSSGQGSHRTGTQGCWCLFQWVFLLTPSLRKV